jgi:hypothetical protein
MLRVLLRHVRELAWHRHGLEHDQHPEQQHEEDSERYYDSMRFENALNIAHIISTVNR